MGRAGRPRHRGQRYPNGQLVRRTDHGTPQVRAWRIRLAGAGNETLSYYPLGVALARSIVTQAEHDAGLRYQRAFAIAMERSPTLSRSSVVAMIGGYGGSDLSVERRRQATEFWFKCGFALSKCGGSVKTTVDEIVVFCQWRPWLFPEAPRIQAWEVDRIAFQTGLRVLVSLRFYDWLDSP